VAQTVALRAAARQGPDARVADAALCHGAAGVAHCFNRIFQATRNPLFMDAATSWFARCLEMTPPGEGFESLKVWDNKNARWEVKPGLLEGAAGIALALLAATTEVEPQWDAALLISVPPIIASRP
jgi:hypothetical protein